MIWSIVQVIGKQGTTLLTITILALFLNPTDFGILGMAMAWIAFIQIFSELGFGAALIQRQDLNSRYFSTIFFINVAAGIFLTLIGVSLSGPCAIFFKTPRVKPIMAVLSLGFAINSFSLTQVTLAQKELRFRDLAIRDISAALIGGIAGIISVILGFGVWSLVIQLLTAYLIGSILLWCMVKWRPIFREFSLQCAKELWPYSSKIFAFQIFKYFAQNIDKLIIGYFLGPVALGLYTFAFRLVAYPVSTVVGAIGNYLFPKFSIMQNSLKEINKSYLFIVKAINAIVFPFLVMVGFLSPVFIPAIWGQKWIQAIPLIQIFAVLAIAGSFISPVGQLMKALDRPGWLFIWSIYITVTIAIFVWLGVSFRGILGGAFGITMAYISGIPIIAYIVNKLLNVSYLDILKSLFPSILSGLIMGLLVFGILNFKIFMDPMNVLVGTFSGALLYLICLILFDKTFMVTIYRRLAKA